MSRRAWWVALLLLGGPGFARADGAAPSLADRLALSGSLRTGYWSSDRKLDDQLSFTPISVWGKIAPDLGGGFGLQAEGWVADQEPLRGHQPKGELREGLLAWHGSSLDFSLGRRLVSWGRADRINPTDLIVSRDYTLLFTEDDDQKRGSFMATAAYGFADFTATAYWLPEMRANIYPVPTSSALHVHQPHGSWQAGQFAARLDRAGGGFDWSVSVFDGIGRDPDAKLSSVGPARVSVDVVHHRERAIAADFATNRGAYGLRGELAYVRPAGRGADDLFDRGRFVSLVFGADRNLTEHLTVNIQYLLHYVTDDLHVRRDVPPPFERIAARAALLNNQLKQVQQGGTLRVAYTALHETLTSELATAGYFTDGSAAVRPKFLYSLNDHVKVIVGADLFFGEDESYFGQIKKNRSGYAEFRYSF